MTVQEKYPIKVFSILYEQRGKQPIVSRTFGRELKAERFTIA